MQGYASFFSPLVFGMYKDLITAIGLYALPCGNAIAIGINLLGNTLRYFLFQARRAWGMYYVVHIFVRKKATAWSQVPFTILNFAYTTEIALLRHPLSPPYASSQGCAAY